MKSQAYLISVLLWNLQKFYNQVSTPLLKKLEFNYPQGVVSDVTHNSFQNYFGGSEIVVAGKVDADKAQHLESVITATAVSTVIILHLTFLTMDIMCMSSQTLVWTPINKYN